MLLQVQIHNLLKNKLLHHASQQLTLPFAHHSLFFKIFSKLNLARRALVLCQHWGCKFLLAWPWCLFRGPGSFLNQGLTQLLISLFHFFFSFSSCFSFFSPFSPLSPFSSIFLVLPLGGPGPYQAPQRPGPIHVVEGVYPCIRSWV